MLSHKIDLRPISFSIPLSVIVGVDLIILSEYLFAVTDKATGIIDDLIRVLILAISFFLILEKGKIRRLENVPFVISFFGLFALSFSTHFNSIVPTLYEWFKLNTFLTFLPLLLVIEKKSVYKIDEAINRFLGIFLSINLFVIVLQYVISPYIITYVGIPTSQIENTMKNLRWVGLFEGINTFGDVVLYSYVFARIFKTKGYKLNMYVSGISIMISTSKHAIVLFLLVLFIENFHNLFRSVKQIVAAAIFGLVALVPIFKLNERLFVEKFDQYSFFVDHFEELRRVLPIIHEYVEVRGVNAAKGIIMFFENPLGYGVGTWGDASSGFSNKKLPFEIVEMCDSYFIHLLVEQGVFMVIFLFFVFSGYYSVTKKYRSWFLILVMLFYLSAITNMGMSAPIWPAMFAYIYGRLMLSKTDLKILRGESV